MVVDWKFVWRWIYITVTPLTQDHETKYLTRSEQKHQIYVECCHQNILTMMNVIYLASACHATPGVVFYTCPVSTMIWLKWPQL